MAAEYLAFEEYACTLVLTDITNYADSSVVSAARKRFQDGLSGYVYECIALYEEASKRRSGSIAMIHSYNVR